MLIIDVRTPDEFNDGHLADAIHIEYQYILMMIEQYAPDKTAEIGLYCHAGVRSAYAQYALLDAGYVNAINLGGFDQLKRHYPFV